VGLKYFQRHRSTDGAVSHWKYILGNVIVYRERGPRPEERLGDIRSSRRVSGSDSSRCRKKAMDHEYQNVFYHNVARR
jgi:hypothetical protein